MSRGESSIFKTQTSPQKTAAPTRRPDSKQARKDQEIRSDGGFSALRRKAASHGGWD